MRVSHKAPVSGPSLLRPIFPFRSKPQFSVRNDFLRFYARAREYSAKKEGIESPLDIPLAEEFSEHLKMSDGEGLVVVEDFSLVARLADPVPSWMPANSPFEKQQQALGGLLYALRLYCNPGMSKFGSGLRWAFDGDLHFPGVNENLVRTLKEGLLQSRVLFSLCDQRALVPFELAERLPWGMVWNIGRDEWGGVNEARFLRDQFSLPRVLNLLPETKDFGAAPGFVDLQFPSIPRSPDFVFVNEEPFFQERNVIENLLSGFKIWQPRMIFWLWYKAPREVMAAVESALKRGYHIRSFESGFPDPAVFPYSHEQFMRGVEGYAGMLAYK